MDKIPCQVPLSPNNRVCEVTLIGKGPVRMVVADLELQKSGQLGPIALVSVEYQPDCDNARFDFKTLDGVLPRGAAQDGGVTVWENKLLKVTHRRVASPPKDRCTLLIEAAPALLARVKAVGALTSTAP